MLWIWLVTELRPGLRILHSAPETAIYKKLRARQELDYVTTELNQDAHASDPHIVQADLQALPFLADSFDLVLCSHVLEHVPDDHAAMREVARILRGEGQAVFQVPISDRETTYEDFEITAPEERIAAFGQADHVRLYGRDFDERLRAAGFEVTVVAGGHPSADLHIARPAAQPDATG